MEQLLIIGIDPGTTTAYALLDIKGDIIGIDSSKDFDLSRVIEIISKNGLPLIVGCDKKNIPGFVESFATKTGARLYWPDEDMKVDEKKSMVNRWTDQTRLDLTAKSGKTPKNEHERDALASAIFAFKKARTLLEKIYHTLRRENKLEKINEVTKLVVSTEEGMSIKLALDILEKPQDEDIKVIKKAIEKKEFSKSYMQIYEKMKALEKENKMLVDYNKKLDNQLKNLRDDFNRMIKDISRKISDEKVQYKEEKKQEMINSMRGRIADKDNVINSLAQRLHELNHILKNAERYLIIKKVKNLGEYYTRHKKELDIKDNDVLFVGDTSIVSQKNIEEIKPKVSIIVCEKPSRTIKENFIAVDVKNIKYRESEDFLFAEKSEFNKMLDKSVVLHKVIKEYKEERKD